MQRFIIALVYLASVSLYSIGQDNPTSGGLEIIYSETFDWENQYDPKGWTMPDGYYMEDPNDTGFNWHWWPNDSLVADLTFEPPFRSTSASDGQLCLFANLYNNYVDPPSRTSINNSIVFPLIDCSDHASVIVRFQTSFQNAGWEHFDNWSNLVEVSNNYGVHWASFNAGFGCGHRDRPNDVAPGEPAIFEANITAIAAGMPAVLIRINWQNYFGIYYWIIDDFELVEAYDNDLRVQSIDIQWDDMNIRTEEGFSYMLPISQLIDGHGFHLLESTVINMGENLQTGIMLNLNVIKNNQSKYSDEKALSFLDTEWEGTLLLDGKYIPDKEFGKHEITFNWTQDEEESYPEDNLNTLSFLITDSVYSRADDTADYPFSYRYAEDEPGLNAIVDHYIGSKFPIYGDCEIDGVSVYIMGGLADGLIHFRYVAFVEVRDENEEIIDRNLLLSSDLVDLDSSMFNQWIYLPFDKDGESEFIFSETVLYAGIQYSDYHPDEMTRRNQGLTIGADNSSPSHDPRSVFSYRTSSWETGPYVSKRNLMVRLLLNDHTDLSGRDNVLNNPFSLNQNYPNPFAEETNITYTLSKPSQIDIVIRDITGKTVMVINEGMRSLGKHSVSLKTKGLGAGLYTYTIIAGDFQETKQMVISK